MKLILIFILCVFSSRSVFSFTLTNQVGWGNKTLAVNVNMTNCPSDILERLDDAFKLWNSVATSSLKLSLGSTASTTTPAQLKAGAAADSPLVVCDIQIGTTHNVDDNSVAGVGFGASSNGEYLDYGGLYLNVRPGSRGDITNSSVATKNVVVTHELGHMLGLGHSSADSSLMYYSAGSRDTVSLSKDDWDGLSYLYPRDELSKTNLAAGCGLVKNQPPNFSRIMATLLLMILPLILYVHLRRTKNYILT